MFDAVRFGAQVALRGVRKASGAIMPKWLTWEWVTYFTGALIGLGAIFAATGFEIEVPWPAKADVAEIARVTKANQETIAATQATIAANQEALVKLTKDVNDLTRASLQQTRNELQRDFELAEADAARDLENGSARREVKRLKKQIDEIDRALEGSPHP